MTDRIVKKQAEPAAPACCDSVILSTCCGHEAKPLCCGPEKAPAVCGCGNQPPAKP